MSLDRTIVVPLVLLTFASLPNLSESAVVSTCDESALRAAISSGGTITFACDGTITLSDTLRITQDTVLDGRGRRVTLSGDKRVRVLLVEPSVRLALWDLTIAFGQSLTGGGIYNNAGGSVTLVNCVLATNCATAAASVGANGFDVSGGGIYNRGSLALSNCVLVGNVARGGAGGNGTPGAFGSSGFDQYGRCRPISPPGNGGPGFPGGRANGAGLYNAGTSLLVDCTLEGNRSEGGAGGSGGNGGIDIGCWGSRGYGGPAGAGGVASGAGVYNAGDLEISNLTFARNIAIGGTGGQGGSNGGSSGVFAPAAGADGGAAFGTAIWNGGTNRILNTTVGENLAVGGAGGPAGRNADPCSAYPVSHNGNGGAARAAALANEGYSSLRNVTVWNNAAVGGSGTIHYEPSCPLVPGSNGVVGATSLAAVSGVLTMVNSIVGNLAFTNNCTGMIDDGGHNIGSDNSANFSAPGSLNGIDPRVGPLVDNGGPTHTMALEPGSPALDAGNADSCSVADQRGAPRPSGPACDVGAFEGTNGIYNLTVQVAAMPDSFPTGQVATLRVVLSNPNAVAISNASLAVALPAAITINGWSSSCGGEVLPPSDGQFRLWRLNLAGGQSCTVEFTMVGSAPGGHTLAVLATSELTGAYPRRGTVNVAITSTPSVVTGNATDLMAYSARLHGGVTPNGLPAETWFEWGTNSSYGRQTVAQPISAPASVSNTLADLAPATIYHFRVVGQNANGTSYGSNQIFQTLSGIPDVTTGVASEETRTSARLAGYAITRGLSATAYFEYGPTANYGSRSPIMDLPHPQRYTPLQTSLGGLEPGAVYHYRLVGFSETGTNYGADDLFATLGAAGYALSFSGISGSIRGNTRFTNPTTFTLALWFRTTSLSGGTLATFTVNPFISFNPQDDRHIYLSSTGEICFGVLAGGMRTIHSSPGYNDGRWHHVAAVLSSQGMKLFLDGDLAAADPTVTTADNHAGQWRLAYGYLGATAIPSSPGWPGATGNPLFAGQMDEIHYWALERTPEQIQHEMNWLLTGSEQGLVFYWACNEGTGATLTDNSGHGHTASWEGTFPDMRWTASSIPARFLAPISRGPWGVLYLAFPGAPGNGYVLEASADFHTWQRTKTNAAGLDGVVQFQTPLGTSNQFFRTVSP